MKESLCIAKQVDFKLHRKNSRVIESIDRYYKVENPDDNGIEKRKYSLDEVLEMYVANSQYTESNTDEYVDFERKEHLRNILIEQRRGKRTYPIAKLIQAVVYCVAAVLATLAFTKFILFEYIKTISGDYYIPIYIALSLISIVFLYAFKISPYLHAVKHGEKQWLNVLYFYDSERQYWKNKGSSRAKRFSESNERYMYLHAKLNDREIDLIIEDRIYKHICDLKRIPVYVYKNRIYIDENAVDISKIVWRAKR